MAIIAGVLSEELDRVQKNIASYRKMLEILPKGSIVIQKIEGISYVYRKFKQDNKVVSIYIGKEEAPESVQAMKNRNEFLRLQKNLKDSLKEEARLRKALRHYE